ncbi:hypothetical protein CDAR_525581 [Caerostris darwini]|uniref:Uncharacterized protein n=1 Tax=Caerostris darwini TaxID=1538125 RepID=A0AAV4VM52_9ARAC|nr:hypothetical protein CDAR_525581 [Caerostris darwini]
MSSSVLNTIASGQTSATHKYRIYAQELLLQHLRKQCQISSRLYFLQSNGLQDKGKAYRNRSHLCRKCTSKSLISRQSRPVALPQPAPRQYQLLVHNPLLVHYRSKTSCSRRFKLQPQLFLRFSRVPIPNLSRLLPLNHNSLHLASLRSSAYNAASTAASAFSKVLPIHLILKLCKAVWLSH